MDSGRLRDQTQSILLAKLTRTCCEILPARRRQRMQTRPFAAGLESQSSICPRHPHGLSRRAREVVADLRPVLSLGNESFIVPKLPPGSAA